MRFAPWRAVFWAALFFSFFLPAGVFPGGAALAVERKLLDKVRIVVGDSAITAREVDAMYRLQATQLSVRYRGADLAKKEAELQKTIVPQLVEDLLLENRARKLGMEIDNKEIDERVETIISRDPEILKTFSEDTLRTFVARQMLRGKVVDREIAPYIHVGEEEIIQACKDQPGGSKEVHVAHILVKGGSPASLDKIQKIRKTLVNGANFLNVAQATSDDPSAATNRGDLGFVGHGQLVRQFEEVAFDLKVGELSQPVLTEFGYHLIKKLGERTKQTDDCLHMDPYDKNRFAQQVYQSQWNERQDKFLEGLKSKTFIKIYP
ncbi:MAG: peptidylprolyl isomerase [Deltaproteobacteria bacterium]|nr:peptidylprolyl isomerase [Deltaproteobacteria bacterium]